MSGSMDLKNRKTTDELTRLFWKRNNYNCFRKKRYKASFI